MIFWKFLKIWLLFQALRQDDCWDLVNFVLVSFMVIISGGAFPNFGCSLLFNCKLLRDIWSLVASKFHKSVSFCFLRHNSWIIVQCQDKAERCVGKLKKNIFIQEYNMKRSQPLPICSATKQKLGFSRRYNFSDFLFAI